jgi:hypothetical protein
MFFELFDGDAAMPAGWAIEHLWTAEVMISSIAGSKKAGFVRTGDEGEFRARLLDEALHMAECGNEGGLFPDAAFGRVVLDSMPGFILAHTPHMMEYIRDHSDLAPVPVHDVVARTIASNRGFREFVRRQSRAMSSAG